MSALTKVSTGGLHPTAKKLEIFLKKRLIGQPKAIERIVTNFNLHLSPLKDPQTPIIVSLLMGGTGTGKTLTAELVAEFFFGTRDGMTKLSGTDYTKDHTIFDLTGSPKSYVGYYEVPRLAQQKIDKPALEYRNAATQRKDPQIRKLVIEMNRVVLALSEKNSKSKAYDEMRDHYTLLKNRFDTRMEEIFQDEPLYSVILMDEFEKADQAIWNILLEIATKGRIDIRGYHEGVTSFHNSFIFLTSNIASKQLSSLAEGKLLEIGFSPVKEEDDEREWKIAYSELKSLLSAELLNRLDDNTVVYHRLTSDELMGVLGLEFDAIAQRLWQSMEVTLIVSDSLIKYVHQKVIERPEFGGRQAYKRVKRYLCELMAKPLNSGEIRCEDIITADINKKTGEIIFLRSPRFVTKPKSDSDDEVENLTIQDEISSENIFKDEP
jgi:ATP-dependent Clp protease ATP-binding subunit ClpA